ncbi:MAG: hypothetical protein COB17_07420 [Sulfurimonas sp.]|nr:MAG: hypothetical protein COB17_07420 [Sulfurimonas sp.]
MRLSFKIKHYFFSAFREFFVHHHNSLEFRAKLFALLIAADEKSSLQSCLIVKNIGMDIYKNDEDRSNLLMLSTKELVQKVKDNNGLDIDTLITNIQKEVRIIPRYAKKINIENLQQLLNLTTDVDVLAYQENIIEFLQTLKDDTLQNKKQQIAKDEENLESKY